MVKSLSASVKTKMVKIDKFFYRTPEGHIIKYSQYCQDNDCKTESSYIRFKKAHI